MKMSKKMTKREKIMLGILIVIIIVLGWYKLVFEPINNEIDAINAKAETEQAEIDANIIPLATLNKMEQTLNEYKEKEIDPIMPVADNSKELLLKLNSVMSLAEKYSIEFGEPEQDDYLVNRKVNLSFTAPTYLQARDIIDKLNSETYINQISDVEIEIKNSDIGSTTEVALTITFFEVSQ